MTTPIDVLREAITRQKSVSFHYINPNKPLDSFQACVGNPHAVYATASGNINLELFQTSGAVFPAGTKFPVWRDYSLKFITKIKILESQPSFDLAADYKSDNRKYERKFFKI
jgi:hypothetical protein